MAEGTIVPAWVGRWWNRVSHALNIQQLLALIGVWHFVAIFGGALAGLIIAAIAQFPWWGWILAVALGVGLALFISNEITSRRLNRRHGQYVPAVASVAVDSAPDRSERLGEELATAERRIDDLVKVREELTREVQAKDRELLASAPSLRWVQELVADARGKEPFMLARPDASLDWDTAATLKKVDPWFDLHLELEYRDVHRLIIGETVEGMLARWNGEKFHYDTRFYVEGAKKSQPYDRVGWSIVRLRLHQRLTRESADSILEALRKYASPNSSAINFDASNLQISVRVLSAVDDEVLYEGALRLGSELATRYTLQE